MYRNGGDVQARTSLIRREKTGYELGKDVPLFSEHVPVNARQAERPENCGLDLVPSSTAAPGHRPPGHPVITARQRLCFQLMMSLKFPQSWSGNNDGFELM